MQNPILDLINSLDVPQVQGANTMLQGANDLVQKGFSSFQSVADDMDRVHTNRKIKELISTTDMSDPYAGQQSMLNNLLGIRGVDPKDAMGISSGIANPLIDKMVRKEDVDYRNKVQTNLQNYRNTTSGETYRHNKATESKGFAPKGFGAYTNEYGDVVIYDKDTGLPPGSSTSSSNASSIPLLTQSGDNGSTSNVGALIGSPENTYLGMANKVDVANGNINPNGVPKPQVRNNTATQDTYRIPKAFITTTKVQEPDGNGGYTERTVTVDKRNPGVELEHLGRGYFKPTGKSAVSTVPEKQSTNQEKDIKGVSNVVGGFKRVKELFHPELVGPYDSRMTGVKSVLGIQGDENAPDSTEKGNELESATAQIVNDIRHSQFGSALTGYEIEEWKKGVPDVGMNELEFIPKWNQFIDTTIDHGNDALKNLRNQKRYHDAKQLENEIKSLENYKLDLQDYKDDSMSVFTPLGRQNIMDNPGSATYGLIESATPMDSATTAPQAPNDFLRELVTPSSESAFNTGKSTGSAIQTLLPGARNTGAIASTARVARPTLRGTANAIDSKGASPLLNIAGDVAKRSSNPLIKATGEFISRASEKVRLAIPGVSEQDVKNILNSAFKKATSKAMNTSKVTPGGAVNETVDNVFTEVLRDELRSSAKFKDKADLITGLIIGELIPVQPVTENVVKPTGTALGAIVGSQNEN